MLVVHLHTSLTMLSYNARFVFLVLAMVVLLCGLAIQEAAAYRRFQKGLLLGYIMAQQQQGGHHHHGHYGGYGY